MRGTRLRIMQNIPNQTNLLAAKPILEREHEHCRQEVQKLKAKGIVPSLKIIVVGDRVENALYAKKKVDLCAQIGAEAEFINFPENITEETFTKRVQALNDDPAVHGIIVQLPVPAHLHVNKIFSLIAPEKDVDGFHPANINKLYFKEYDFEHSLLPCTAVATIQLLNHYKITLSGKHVVLIGRSFIVTKPLLMMLNDLNATVTWCHSKTEKLESVCQSADIIISATGKSEFINSSFINTHRPVYVVDIGIARTKEGKIRGDVDQEAMKTLNNVSYTPVPGGIGPLTVINVVKNLIKCARNISK